jgi:hypothetical protein
MQVFIDKQAVMQQLFQITAFQATAHPYQSEERIWRPLVEFSSQIHQPFYQFVPTADYHLQDPQELSNAHQASIVLWAVKQTQFNLVPQHSQFYINNAKKLR